MDLSNLKPAAGSTKKNKRLGRGVGSGKGGHSSTRGNKGQKSISGGGTGPHFEGGQMPLQRRLPKFGFKNPNRVEYKAVNLSTLAQLVQDGRLNGGEPITPETLSAAGVTSKTDLIKVLGSGEVTTALNVTAHAFSASARQKLEAAGGSANVLA